MAGTESLKSEEAELPLNFFYLLFHVFFSFLVVFFFAFKDFCNALFTNEMKRNFLVTLSILALSCRLPSFSCLLSYSMSMLFEGFWSSSHWFALFVHDWRSFRGHSNLTFSPGVRAWGPNFSLLWGSLFSPASVGFLLRDWGFLTRVFFLVEMRSLVS